MRKAAIATALLSCVAAAPKASQVTTVTAIGNFNSTIEEEFVDVVPGSGATFSFSTRADLINSQPVSGSLLFENKNVNYGGKIALRILFGTPLVPTGSVLFSYPRLTGNVEYSVDGNLLDSKNLDIQLSGFGENISVLDYSLIMPPANINPETVSFKFTNLALIGGHSLTPSIDPNCRDFSCMNRYSPNGTAFFSYNFVSSVPEPQNMLALVISLSGCIYAWRKRG